MSEIKVKDIVGVSRDTFSHAIKTAVEEGIRTVGTVKGVEVAPPWNLEVTDDGEVEFSTTVRILYTDA